MALHLAQDEAADRLLSENPLALLVGFVLDQQVPLERAFSAPKLLQERLGGHLDVETLASLSETELAALFSEKPALHRFPASMATRVHELSRVLLVEYGGNAAGVWKSAKTGAELLANVRGLPGFGEQKARIFVAFLGKRLRVRPAGWAAAAGAFAEPGSHLSVADIDGPDSLARVREHKQAMKLAAKSVAGLQREQKAKRRPAR